MIFVCEFIDGGYREIYKFHTKKDALKFISSYDIDFAEIIEGNEINRKDIEFK